MTFISYAQNGEDVILWRALKHINQGFYIDVGANDPEDDSITKAFYDQGWHGINIEPLTKHYAALQINRPRDINLQMAAGDFNGELKLFDVRHVRGWATSDVEIAEQYRQQGLAVEEILVPVRRLDSLCAEFSEQQIHFLKIDVEGFEREVLLGMDFQKWRPWILIIEATRPNSQQTQYQNWEPMLIENQYCYAYNDGLNRYYVAQEHLELLDMLSVQPNVFDDYQFIGYHRIEQALPRLVADNKALNQQLQILDGRLQQAQQVEQQLNDQLKSLDQRLQQSQQIEQQLNNQLKSLDGRLQESQQAEQRLNGQLQENQQQRQQLSNQLIAINNSLSWRITQPLRLVRHYLWKAGIGLRLLRNNTFKQLLKITPNSVKRPLKALLYRLKMKTYTIEASHQFPLSPRAEEVYLKLQKAVKARAN